MGERVFRKPDRGAWRDNAGEVASEAGVKRFAVDRSKMFDLGQTQVLSELFRVARDERDDGWRERFFLAVWNASLEVATPPVFRGPDLFPYLRLHVPAPGKPFQSNSLANVAQQAVENAWGIAVFGSPEAAEPEFVMSMGLVDSLLRYDSWMGDPVDLEDIARAGPVEGSAGGLETVTTTEEQRVLVGSPSSSYLPAYTARALYRHLTEGWKIPEPRIALLMNPAFGPTRNLVINRRLGDFASPEIAGQQCRLLLWYLPPKRGLMLMLDGWTDGDMRSLKEFFPEAISSLGSAG